MKDSTVGPDMDVLISQRRPSNKLQYARLDLA